VVTNLKPYAAYKESRLPWIGAIPSHWDFKRGKALFKESQLAVRDADEIVTCFRDGQVTLRRNRRTSGFMMAFYESGYQGVRKGQLVIHAMDAFAGAVGVSDSNGKCTPEYIVVDPRTDAALAGYFAQVLRFAAHQKFILVSCPAVRERAPRFRYPDFGSMQMPLPPAAEQAAIVRFLDWANGRLERAIRAKRKVIALLNEQKQAIIHRAVTRGLDPSVRLKPSGIPWLGDIPQHWGLSPNRAFLRIRKVLVGERHPQFRLLSLTKRGVIVRDLSEMRGKFSADIGTSQEVRSGDLVFCLFDVPETPRTVGLSQHNGMITGAYTVMECSDLEMAKFLELFYVAMDDRKLLSPIYSGLRNTIPKDRFLGAKTPIPPASERAAIVTAVEDETASLNQTISRLEREIELLREYRTRLVADVVTGKLDVREAAAQLPDEAPLDSGVDGADLSDQTEPADEEANVA